MMSLDGGSSGGVAEEQAEEEFDDGSKEMRGVHAKTAIPPQTICVAIFGLLVNGHRTSALVPHADMLNHFRPRETKWTFCEETQCFTITTLQSIGRWAQVYDSYGQKCNHRFLLNHGFCVEKNVEVDGFCPNEVPLELGLYLAELRSSGRGVGVVVGGSD